MPNRNFDFSIIIPTYTGQEHIEKCFQSILNQKYEVKPDFEVVVVIDGPNDQLRQIVEANKLKFEKLNIDFNIFQFEQNKGRFEARLKGANLAKSNQLLFIDDRITFKDDYFKTLINSKQPILIPNVIETESKNNVSRCLYLLRRRIYGKNKFGAEFESYFIDNENFEKSPKGTTSLWITKKIFLDACEIITSKPSSKNINDDTALFKYVISKDIKIYKSSEATIEYNPRSSVWAEIEHIYQRGPRFIDYYLQPGTRFFMPLIVAILLLLAAVILALLFPKILLVYLLIALLVDVLLSLFIAEKLSDIVQLFYLPLIVISFGLGVIKGVAIKFVDYVTKITKGPTK